MGHIVIFLFIFIGGGGFNNHNGSILLSIILSPTSIYIHVRYGSNLIMSFRVKIQRMIILFEGILGNLLLHPGVPKYRLSIGGIQMEIRKCLDVFWSTPKPVFWKDILYINIVKKKSIMSSNHMKVADWWTTIVRPSYHIRLDKTMLRFTATIVQPSDTL